MAHGEDFFAPGIVRREPSLVFVRIYGGTNSGLDLCFDGFEDTLVEHGGDLSVGLWIFPPQGEHELVNGFSFGGKVARELDDREFVTKFFLNACEDLVEMLAMRTGKVEEAHGDMLGGLRVSDGRKVLHSNLELAAMQRDHAGASAGRFADRGFLAFCESASSGGFPFWAEGLDQSECGDTAETREREELGLGWGGQGFFSRDRPRR